MKVYEQGARDKINYSNIKHSDKQSQSVKSLHKFNSTAMDSSHEP